MKKTNGNARRLDNSARENKDTADSDRTHRFWSRCRRRSQQWYGRRPSTLAICSRRSAPLTL
jgi:hypothetical protein